MVTRTTDIDHPDRNCVSRVCDKCETVIARIHHEWESALETYQRDWARRFSGWADLCRKCKEKANADQEKTDSERPGPG